MLSSGSMRSCLGWQIGSTIGATGEILSELPIRCRRHSTSPRTRGHPGERCQVSQYTSLVGRTGGIAVESLMTGGTGLVGRHLMRALQERGDTVRALVL